MGIPEIHYQQRRTGGIRKDRHGRAGAAIHEERFFVARLSFEGLKSGSVRIQRTEDLFLNYYCYADADLYSDLDTVYTQLIQGAEQWDAKEGYDGYTTLRAFILSKQAQIEDLINRG